MTLCLLVLAAATAPLSAQAAGGTEPSLLLRYQFEETGGTTVVDSSGHGFDGTYINPPAWDAGVSGRSFKMNGGALDSPTAAHVKIPGGVLRGLDAVTIATWVKWEGEGPWQWLYGLGIDTNKYILATPRSGGGALYSAIKDGGAEQSLHGNVVMDNGKWRHLAVTITANDRSVLYLDGEKVAENNNVTIKPSALHSAERDCSGYIGKSFYPDPYFQGAVDDFRIYSAALTAAQVDAIYGEGMPAAQAVALVESNLTIGRAIIVNDLSLPASRHSVPITWKSSNPALVGHNGAVKRPAKGQPVGVATLTASIGKDGITATKVFTVNVPPVGHPLKFESYNPVLKRDAEGNRLFTADPAALVDGDTLYIYAGRDEAAIGGWFLMNEWVCYSTKDMVDWKYEGSVLKATDFAWGAPGTAWACQVVKRHGKYFLYSTTGRPDRQGYTVGVAVSDRPIGPFVDAIGGPLFENAITTGGSVEGIEDIDPTVFVDDDGQAYLYWGNSVLHYALLNEDMISLKDLDGDGKITEGADIFSNIEIKDRPTGFGEAPWLYKANGKYYLVDAMSMPQQVAYAMSDSPRGPWQYKGIILNENIRPDGSQGDFSSDTNHPAVIEFKGQWYVFYHNAAQPTGGQTRRSVCVEKMSYNADGTIARSFITSTGPIGEAVRIQSGRQADHYVTFSGFDVKLDTLPADDRAFRWEVTLGLADEATLDTVSMQSVAYPGYYLTVKGDAVALEKNDASADFRRRATFRMIPVPSDKKLTAFQSLADPARYLRCSAATGKLTSEIFTPATNSADQSDATFKFISDADAY